MTATLPRCAASNRDKILTSTSRGISKSLALPIVDRCERPTGASAGASKLQPGRFRQGPDPKMQSGGFSATCRFDIVTTVSDPEPANLSAALVGATMQAITRDFGEPKY